MLHPTAFIVGYRAYRRHPLFRLDALLLRHTLSDRKATFPKIKGDQLKQLPIAIGTREQRKAIGTLYSKLAKAEEQLRETRSGHQETAALHRFAHLERQLNEAVFALYGLMNVKWNW